MPGSIHSTTKKAGQTQPVAMHITYVVGVVWEEVGGVGKDWVGEDWVGVGWVGVGVKEAD